MLWSRKGRKIDKFSPKLDDCNHVKGTDKITGFYWLSSGSQMILLNFHSLVILLLK